MRHAEPYDLTLSGQGSLPGEGVVDSNLVARAVRHIRALHLGKVLEFHRALGEHVLRTFFEDDVSNFKERGRSHRSYAHLAEELQDQLGLSPSSVWYSVALVEQFRVLSEELAASLPMSHHRLLIHVQDLPTRRALAVEAAAEGMSKRELEDRIRVAAPTDAKPHGGGRRKLPALVKAVRKLCKGTERNEVLSDLSDLDALGDRDLKQLEALLAAHLVRCEQIHMAVKERVRDDDAGTRRRG